MYILTLLVTTQIKSREPVVSNGEFLGRCTRQFIPDLKSHDPFLYHISLKSAAKEIHTRMCSRLKNCNTVVLHLLASQHYTQSPHHPKQL